MKTVIWIRDMHPAGYLAVDLRHVLDALGQDAETSEWLVRDVWATGESYEGFEELQADLLIAGRTLIALANHADQVIDGEFFGFRKAASEAWIRVLADDSTLYEVETDDDLAAARILRRFSNTEMRKPNTGIRATAWLRRP